jgi:hypothetical protein
LSERKDKGIHERAMKFYEKLGFIIAVGNEVKSSLKIG